MKDTLRVVVVVIVVVGTVLSLHGLRASSTQTPAVPAEGVEPRAAAPEAFTRVCGKCHDAARIVQNRRLRIQWEEVLEAMVQRGAKGSDQDLDEVMEYLVAEYGRVNVNADTADELAEVLHLDSKDATVIVDYRKAHGKFADFDALARVPSAPIETLRKYRDALAF